MQANPWSVPVVQFHFFWSDDFYVRALQEYAEGKLVARP